MTQDMINKIMTRLIFTQKDCTATLRSLVEERFFLCNKTALRLALDEITARAPRDYGSSLTSLRLVVTLLLMMVVGVGSVKADDIHFFIINNSGERVIEYIDNTGTATVHAKVKSPFATNFRFYDSEEAAQYDASNGSTAAASTYSENVITAGTSVTSGPIYIRYDYASTPTNDNCKDANNNYIKIDGNTYYEIKITNGNVPYPYYVNKDDKVKGETTAPSAYDKTYMWKFVGAHAGFNSSDPDPYNISIINAKGEEDAPTYVLTGDRAQAMGTGPTVDQEIVGLYYYAKDKTISGHSILNKFFFVIVTWSLSSSPTYPNAIQLMVAQPCYVYDATGNPNSTRAARWIHLNGDGSNPYQLRVDSRQERQGHKSKIVLTPRKPYHEYIIEASDGTDLVRAYPDVSERNTLGIPAKIRSPFASYTYYTSEADAAAGTNAISELPNLADCSTIYVRYTTQSGDMDFNGGTDYFICTNGNYLYAASSNTLGIESSLSDPSSNTRKWKILGNDAYQLTLQNVDNNQYVTYDVSSGEAVPTLSGTGSKFFLHQSNTGQYEVVAITSGYYSTNYYSMGVANSTLKLYSSSNYPMGQDEVQSVIYSQLTCATPDIAFDNTTNQVTITCATDGATIHYTTNGDEPTESSPSTPNPFTINAATTVKAIATHAGYLISEVAELSISQVATPTIQDNGSNAISITSATDGATIYYTTDGSTPSTSSTEYTGPLTENVSGVTIKAIAVKENMIPSAVGSGTVTLQCASPVIARSGNNGFTITCDFPSTGVTIYYTTNGSNPTTSSSSITSGGVVTAELPITVKAMAVATGYSNSTVATVTVTQGMGGDGSAADPYTIENQDDVNELVSKANTSDGASKHYKVTATSPLDFSGASAITQPFSGTFDGGLQTISGLDHALFNSVDGGTVKNVILANVTISGSGPVGAIAGTASGYSRIYNCGILPSSNKYDAQNETSYLQSTGGENSYCGGLVGWLKDDSRVINCFSYANITGGTDVAGIVGHNEIASTTEVTDDKYANLRTAVVNCMFYGNLSGGTNTYPVYGGSKILNNTDTGINSYDFYRADASVGTLTDYNCSWPAMEEYLTKYEFYRNLLNSNRELCGWWVGAPSAPSTMSTTDVQAVPKDASLMAKWVLDPSIAPYPILKHSGFYPSMVNRNPRPGETNPQRIDPETKQWVTRTYSTNTEMKNPKDAPETDGRSLGKITVKIKKNSSDTGTDKDIIITSMDVDNNDFCYGKIQLPYYNSIFGNPAGSTWDEKYGGNYKDEVVVGWEITGVTGGTAGTLTKNWQTGYNFADRNCTAKDQERVFAQGGYYYVPYEVSAITITAKWATAIYLDNGSDHSYDRVNFADMSNPSAGTHFAPAGARSTTLGNGKTVVTGNIKDKVPDGTSVFEKAIVLVGNHQYRVASSDIGNASKACTIMSADFDLDDEPDYTLFWQLGQDFDRKSFCPIRFDFLPVTELGMAMKLDGSTQYFSLGCYRPLGHFEVTETSLIHFGQFEFSNKNRTIYAPLILNGGIFDQYVKGHQSHAFKTADDKIDYVLVGGNVRMPSFTPGAHVNTSASFPTRHCAVNVIGGSIDNLYLTGNYNNGVTPNTDNPHCYIDGGKFKQIAAAGKEGINGDVYFNINHSVINEFYGGSTLADKLVTGNINVTINNSYVTKYCGGPKFGNMSLSDSNPENNKTVITNATGTTFGVYYGGGNGGTSYVQYDSKDNTVSATNYNWTGTGTNQGALNNYSPGTYRNKATGYQANYEMEIVNVSTGTKTGQAVHRTYFYAAQFSATNTGSITNNLTDCKVLTNFYGGGNLGGVKGNVTSKLMGTTRVDGSAFAAGYSASIPEVKIYNKDKTYPTINIYTGIITPTPEGSGTSTTYTWTNKTSLGNYTLSTTNPKAMNVGGINYLYTEESLDNLGSVSGKATINIEGTTTVGGSVYGGGEESGVDGNTEVNVTGGTIGVANAPAYGALVGNVYGGGKGKADDKLAGLVKGNTQVTISGTAESPFIYHNVYGGGAYGSVGDFTYDNTTGMPTALKTENTGVCNVTITGGKIGTNGQNNGMVFGSSRGDVATPVNGVDPNDILAWVYKTNVVIGDETKGTLSSGNGDDYTKPLIKGSVYGSGENGHTLHNTDVKVHSGTIGIAEGEEITYNGIKYSGPRYIFRGNVYGGGCGTDTYDTKDDQNITKTYYNFNAGIVKGNTSVTIDGGHVIHDVYGGGSMGSVGTFTFNDDATDNIKDGKPVSCTEGTGTCNVTISGGMIGTTGMQMTAGGGPDDYGHVFGAGKGETKDSIDYPNVVICAYFNKTEVTINNSAFVMGSVYGGSESGHVLNDTKVTIAGGQIGCGEGKEAAYTEEEWAAESPSTLKPTSHWDYVDDGAPYDQYADEQGNYTSSGESAEGGNKIATDGHTFYGNVFGGGSGYYPYAPKKWLFSAGRVEGKSEVVITGGHILNNVYGGCEMSDVYRNASITMSGGTVGVPRSKGDIKLKPTIGHIYGAGMGDKRIFFNTVTNVQNTNVAISGGKVYGSVHGGGEDGHVLGNTQTTISGNVEIGSVKNGETSGFDGNVFGGGQGSPTALTAGTVGGNVELNIQGGTMYGSVYGGGRIASVGTYFADATHANYGKMQDGDNHGCINVNLTGGTIEQNVFGGCMGTRGHAAVDQVRFAVSKNITVNLNEGVDDDAKGCVVKGSIFGCNNVNSSPQGQVEVHIYKTQNADASQIAGPVSEGVQPKVKGRYDVKAVYGGGNMAAYLPKGPTAPNDDYNGKNTTFKTQVIIEGCEQTSIQQVYGGGNAASTPATDVTVNGCYEIEELFGGGNGDTKITYDEGTTWLPNPGANVGFYNYSEYYKEDGVEKIKDADNADTPENRDKNYGYGTGEAAVNVLGGHIHRVFGGSNTKGNVRKTALTLLEELLKEDGETPCCPFNVEEAYGGGKSAPMDADTKLLMQCIPGLKAVYGGAEAANIQGDVTLNITNGTFDRVFGGNNKSGTISGSITVNIEEVGCRPIIIGELYGGGNLAGYSVYGYNTDGSLKETGSHWDHPQVNVKSFTSIGSVYGGGYGTTATMVGNPTVNINVAMGDKASASAAVIGQDGDNWKDMAVKDAQVVDKSTVGSYPIPYHKSGQIGAISQVFGGGNAAPVKGDTEVNIGTTIGEYEYLPVVIKVGDTFPTLPEGEKYYTRSGTAPDYTYTETTDTTAQADTDYYRKYEIKGVDIRGNVYGGGNNAEVTGNTNVNIGKKKTE